jgi:hypothetical protein
VRPRHENWVPVIEAGRAVTDPAPVRDRSTPEGKAIDYPFTLVEQAPQRALRYPWVSLADKDKASEILREDELRDKLLQSGTFVNPDPKNSKCLRIDTAGWEG